MSEKIELVQVDSCTVVSRRVPADPVPVAAPVVPPGPVKSGAEKWGMTKAEYDNLADSDRAAREVQEPVPEVARKPKGKKAKE